MSDSYDSDSNTSGGGPACTEGFYCRLEQRSPMYRVIPTIWMSRLLAYMVLTQFLEPRPFFKFRLQFVVKIRLYVFKHGPRLKLRSFSSAHAGAVAFNQKENRNPAHACKRGMRLSAN